MSKYRLDWRLAIARGAILAVILGGLVLSALGAPGHRITDFRVARLGSSCQTREAATLAQPFRPGDWPADQSLAVLNGATELPSQADILARNDDGSVRHAVITVDIPCDHARDALLTLASRSRPAGTKDAPAPLRLADLLSTGVDATLKLNTDQIGSEQSNARALIQTVLGQGGYENAQVSCRRWLWGRWSTSGSSARRRAMPTAAIIRA